MDDKRTRQRILGKLVEEKLNLAENDYFTKNSKHQAAELQTCDTL